MSTVCAGVPDLPLEEAEKETEKHAELKTREVMQHQIIPAK